MSTSPRSSLFSQLLLPLASTLVMANAAVAQCTYSWPANPFGTGCDDAVLATSIAANGDLVVGGRFANAGGVAANRIARWDGSAWSALGTGMNGDVLALTRLPSGDLLAGGNFTTAGGVTANCIARWDGSMWSAVGGGLTGPVPFGCSVQSIDVMPNGDVYVGGFFTDAGGVAANNIARWDGATWSALGSGAAGVVRAVVARFDTTVYAAGSFVTAGGGTVNGLARWTTTAGWSSIGTGVGPFLGATSLATDASGSLLYIGGTFLTASGVTVNRIAQVLPFGATALAAGVDGPVTSLFVLPSGDLLVGGAFTQAGGLAANHIARWDGSSWSSFGAGVDASVNAITLDAQGNVVVAGEFTVMPSGAAGRVGRIVSSCAPQVTSIGSGCSGAGGLNVLTASQLPLAGTRFEGTGTGLAPLAFVLAITGLSSIPSTPIALILPQGLPGCTVDVQLDLTELLIPVGGTTSSTLVFPYVPSIVGLSFFHQFVSLEVDLLLNITAITSTNALQMTIGTF